MVKPEIGEFWVVEQPASFSRSRQFVALVINTPDKGADTYVMIEDHPTWGLIPHDTAGKRSQFLEKTYQPEDWPL